MSQDLNNLFRSDPFAFAKANVLWPGDSNGVPGLQPNVNTGYFKAHASIASGESLFQLVGEKRIWSGDLNRWGSKVELTRRTGRVDAPCMAMYYLPWARNECMRTVLRRTRNQAQRGAKTPIPANPPNNAANPPQDTNDPDIFFTAGVNGCMVVVEGTREEPVVYHCNAVSTAGSPMDEAVNNRDAGLAQNKIGQKVNWMTTRMSAMSTAAPKNPKGPVQTAAMRKGTIQTDYMLLADFDKIGAGEEREWGVIQSNIARSIGLHGQSDRRIRIEDSLGTVFGARKNGLWTFYFQKLVCYGVLRKTGRKPNEWQQDQSGLWYVADCREFWPNGAGHAV